MPFLNIIWTNMVLMCLVIFIRAESNTTAPPLLGIDLGFSYITSAYFTEAGPVIASRFEAPELCKRMMLETVNGTADQFCNSDSDKDSLSEELKFIMRQSVADARQKRGDDIEIGAVLIPDHLVESRNANCWLKIFDALAAVSSHDVNSLNVRSARHKIYTFPPDNCYHVFGTYYQKKPFVEEDFLVLGIELANSALKVSLVEIGEPDAIYDSLSTYSVSNVSWLTVDREELQKEVMSMFHDQKVSDVRAVLFSAEHPVTKADEVAIRNVIETLDKAAPGLGAKIHDFGPGIEFRNAIGAACTARQLMIYPSDPDRCKAVYLPEEDALHDEL